MSASKTTEALVRRCFGNGNISFMIGGWKIYARAARRFVRMEQSQKADERHERFLRWCRKHPNRKKYETVWPNDGAIEVRKLNNKQKGE